MLRKVCRALEEAESLLIAVLLLVMTLFAVLQVVTRAMSITIIWMEEATRYCMIWLCFIGMALAVRKHAHICIDMVPDFIKNKLHFKHYDIVVNALIVAFCCFFLFYACELTGDAMASGQLTPGLKIPKWTMYLSMIAGSILTIFHSVTESAFALKGGDD